MKLFYFMILYQPDNHSMSNIWLILLFRLSWKAADYCIDDFQRDSYSSIAVETLWILWQYNMKCLSENNFDDDCDDKRFNLFINQLTILYIHCLSVFLLSIIFYCVYMQRKENLLQCWFIYYRVKMYIFVLFGGVLHYNIILSMDSRWLSLTKFFKYRLSIKYSKLVR